MNPGGMFDTMFQSLQTFFTQNPLYPIIMGIVIVGSIVVNVIMAKKRKHRNADLLQLHPDAAKVFLTTKALITQEAVVVYSVNGNTPHHFTEGGKTGFYAPPGIIDVEMEYSYTRPGVLHKTVTTTTGVVKKKLEIAPHCSYLLGFDRDSTEFTFEKYANGAASPSTAE